MLIATFAIGPATYVWRHIAASPSKRLVGEPPRDLSWRTTTRLATSVGVLTTLAGIAVFIFTPAAAQLAKSPLAIPILMLGLGGVGSVSVTRSIRAGKIQPFVRGRSRTFSRDAQPVWFWASLGWNALLTTFFVVLGIALLRDAPHQARKDRCDGKDSAVTPQQAIDACTALIAENREAPEMLAYYLVARGIAEVTRGDQRAAIANYTRALRSDPTNSYAFYDRALALEELGARDRALPDYDAALRLRPANHDALIRRGLIYLDSKHYRRAIADFSRAHVLEPREAWALGNRGIAHAWLGERNEALADFKQVALLDPRNPAPARGGAILAKARGDVTLEVRYLTRAVRLDPTNSWSRRMRADAYQRMGDTAAADADERAFITLEQRALRNSPR